MSKSEIKPKMPTCARALQCSKCISTCVTMRQAVADGVDLLRVGRVHHAQNELNDSAVELQTSAQQILIQQAHVGTGFGSH